MRVLLLPVFLFWAGAVFDARAQSNSPGPAILKWHYLGGDRLAVEAKGTAFGEFSAMKSWAVLKEQTLEKLSRAPYELLRDRMSGTSDYSALFRPLMEDLLNAESMIEVRATDSGFPELSLALRVTAERAALWKTNLGTALSAWSGVPVRDVTVENTHGWEIKKHHRPNLLRVVSTGQWIVLGLGHDELPLQLETLTFLKAHPFPSISPGSAVLDIEMNLGELSRWTKWPDSAPQRARLSWSPKEQALRADLNFSKAPANPGAWRIPTNLIRGPLLSFTASRGFSGLLDEFPWAAKAGPIPDQFFTWTVARSPLGAFVAAPVTNSAHAFGRIESEMETPRGRRLQSHLPGNLVLQTNKIVLKGLPFLAPFIEAVREPAGDFLFAGMAEDSTNGAPPLKLLSEIQARANLLYFHWESTRERAERWQNMVQLFRVMTQRPLPPTNAAAGLWLSDLVPKLAETRTEITLGGPNELVVTRQGVPGLTGLELIALANWLEMTNFPWGGFRLPSRHAFSNP